MEFEHLDTIYIGDEESGMYIPTGKEIKEDLAWFIEAWAKYLNYDFYTEDYLNIDGINMYLNLNNSGGEILELDPEDVRIRRNDFTFSECQAIGKNIIHMKNMILTYPFQLESGFIKKYKLDYESTRQGRSAKEFLVDLRDNKRNRKYSTLIKQRLLESKSLDEVIYYCIVIYRDICRVYEFLVSRLDKSLPISSKTNYSSPEGRIRTANLVQIVLYHSILIKAKIEPDISHDKVNKCKELAHRYGRKGYKSFQTCYNNLNLTPHNPNNRYQIDLKDVEVVKEALKENYPRNPELLSYLRKMTGPVYS